LQPENATYLGNRAAAYMSANKFSDALDDCKRAAELDPQNAKILLRLARIYTSLGLPEEAIATFGRIQPPPSAKDTAPAKEMLNHIKAAKSALRDGTASMVLYPLNQAVALLPFGAPKPRKWQLMRGEALLKMGDANSLGEIQNIVMPLLTANSQDPEALVLRGRALYAQGENDKAVAHFRKAISCDPEFRDAIKWLRVVQKLDKMKEEGNADYKAGRWQDAIAKYTAALEIDPANKGTNSKLLQNRALCRMKLKQYDEAVSDCDKAITLDPQYMKAHKTKANALGQAERWEEAVRPFRRWIQRTGQLPRRSGRPSWSSRSRSARTTTRFLASRRRQTITRSRRPTASWPLCTIQTRIRETSRLKLGSKTSAKPTRRSATLSKSHSR
jgi:DnaJ family protein C protein 7